MLIREMSDIHLEFGGFKAPQMPEDKDTVLVLAGDVSVVTNERVRRTILVDFLKECSKQFRAVIYVLGNHEHYHFSINITYDTVAKLISDAKLENVFLLENETKIIDDVAFIGATLWTDYNQDPDAARAAERMINDHRLIKIGSPDDPYQSRFSARHAEQLHQDSKQYIFDQTVQQKINGNKVVIVVHHGVSYKSVHPKYEDNPINPSFTSALDSLVTKTQPNIIFHGHTHECFDYMIDNTRVIVNPRGYYGHEQNDFNPTLRIEI